MNLQMHWSFSEIQIRKRKEIYLSNIDILTIFLISIRYFDWRKENPIVEVWIILSIMNGRASYNIQIRAVIQMVTPAWSLLFFLLIL